MLLRISKKTVFSKGFGIRHELGSGPSGYLSAPFAEHFLMLLLMKFFLDVLDFGR